jgi:hypothetical protein
VFFVAVTVATFGFVLPTLFSASDDVSVIAGICVLAGYPVFAWHYGLNLLNQIKKALNNESS